HGAAAPRHRRGGRPGRAALEPAGGQAAGGEGAAQGRRVVSGLRAQGESGARPAPGDRADRRAPREAAAALFRRGRRAARDVPRKLGRYVHLTNYSSGRCTPEIAYMAAAERLDMLLNDEMYGILFRDINMQRTFCDQYISRRICAFAEIIINTGGDNYVATAD